jgi:hypothetical protein
MINLFSTYILDIILILISNIPLLVTSNNVTRLMLEYKPPRFRGMTRALDFLSQKTNVKGEKNKN